LKKRESPSALMGAEVCRGGEKRPCGWLKDKFGLSWQTEPTILPRLLSDEEAAKVQRVMKAMLQMDKLDIRCLEEAAHAS